MSEIKSCKTCPLYAKTAEVKDATGLPYFAMCKGSDRFINEAAARALPGSDLCPAQATPTTTTTESVARFIEKCLDAADMIPAKGMLTTDIGTPVATDDTPPAERPDACHRCVFFVPKTEGSLAFPGTPVARYDTCAKYGNLIMPGTRKEAAEVCTGGIATRMAPATRAKARDIALYPVYLGLPTVVAHPGTSREASLSLVGTCGTCGVPLFANPEDGTAPLDGLGGALCGSTGAAHRLVPHGTVVTPTTTATETKETAPVSTAGKTADIAADATEDALAALLKGLSGLGAELDKPKDTVLRDTDPTTIDSPAVESAEPETVAADGRKSLPKRPKTGMIFEASKYDLSAFEPLPEGAMGVVAVRSTSKASDVVFLPRYDVDWFPEALRKDVPFESETHYMDHNDVLFRCAVAYATDSVAALWGDAGVGKTEGVEHVARLTRQPFMRISIKWATQVDDLMGRWSLADGSMIWLEGRFVKGWRNPYIVCVDEPNCGKDEVWQALRAPFDGARTLVLDEKDGEQIPRNPSARVFTAMNPSWDPRFTGTQPLNDADLDRMQHITVPYPTEDVERLILKAKAPWLSDEQITMMLNSARDIRAAVQANTIRISFGVRKMLRWAEAMQYMHPLQAFKQSVTNWMEPSGARLLSDIVDAYCR